MASGMSLRLKKAVWSTTLPSGPPDNDAARIVQEYLRDPNTVNAVYLLLVDRAQGVPRNWNIVNKALQQLKTHIQKYVPSSDTLGTVLELCRSLDAEVGQAGPQAPAIRSLIDYLKKKLRSTGGLQDGGGSNSSHHMGGASLRDGRMEDMVRQSFEPSEIRKSGPLQPSLDDRTFSGLGAGPSGQGPVKIDIFAQRFALETAGGAAAGAPLSDLVAPDSGRGHLALLQDPLSGARENRTPKDQSGRPPSSPFLQHEERPEVREQMEQIARHHQETAGCSPDGPPMAGGRPRAGMFVPTLYNQQEVMQLSDEEVVVILAAVLGPSSAADGDSHCFEGVDLNQVATPMEVEGTFMPLLIKMIMDFYVTAPYNMSFEMVSGLLHRAVAPREHLSPKTPEFQERVFDLLVNLVVHGELLEKGGKKGAPTPMPAEEGGEGEGEGEGVQELPVKTPGFFGWLRGLLFDALEGLVEFQTTVQAQIGYFLRQVSSSGGSREELKSLSFYRQLSWNGRVWQAALGATFVLSSRCGAIDAKLLQNLPLKVMNAFLESSKRNGWSEALHARLVLLSVAMTYTLRGPGLPLSDEEGGSDAVSDSGSDSEESEESEYSDEEEGGGEEAAIDELTDGSDAARRRARRERRRRGAFPATVWGHVSMEELWLDNWKLRDFGGIYRVMRLYCDSPCPSVHQALFLVVLDYSMQKAWEAIQRRHGGVAAGGLGAPGVAGRDYGSPPKELAKKLANHLLSMRAADLVHRAVLLGRHSVLRTLLTEPLLRDWMDAARKVEAYLAGDPPTSPPDRSLEREFVEETLKILDDCVATRPECQPLAGATNFEEIRRTFDAFVATADRGQKYEISKVIARWFEAEWGPREAESAMFWLLVQVVDAAAWGRAVSDAPAGGPRLTDMVQRRWPIAPCLLLRMWTEAPYHEFVRVVQRLTLHVVARDRGLPGVLPLSREDEKMIGRVPLKSSAYQGDFGAVTLISDAIEVLLSMAPRRPRNPITDWEGVRLLGAGAEEPLPQQLVAALADLTRFLLEVVSEAGRIVGASQGGEDNETGSAGTADSGNGSGNGPPGSLPSASSLGLAGLSGALRVGSGRTPAAPASSGGGLGSTGLGAFGPGATPEGALWAGDWHVHREVVKSLPLAVLARALDVLLDYCQVYPMGANIVDKPAPSAAPAAQGGARAAAQRAETLRGSVLDHPRLVRLGACAVPRDLDRTSSTWQPWYGSLDDLAASLLQLVVWKCQLGPDPAEVEAMGGVGFFKGLLRSRNPAVCHLASRYLQQAMSSRTRELYLKALKQVSRMAQKQGNEGVLSNPYLQVVSLFESTDLDPAVKELVDNLEV